MAVQPQQGGHCVFPWIYLIFLCVCCSFASDNAPYLVKDILQQPLPYNDVSFDYSPEPTTSEFITSGTLTYFSAQDGSNGVELWATDGTSEGTIFIKDIWPGGEGSFPKDYILHDGLIYFIADDGTIGREVWRTDGTTTGTLAIDLWPGQYSSNPFLISSTPKGLVLRYRNEQQGHVIGLLDNDATIPAVLAVLDANVWTYQNGDYYDYYRSPAIGELGGVIYFYTRTLDHGMEPWRTDGTPNGTWMLKDLTPGQSDSYRFNYPFMPASAELGGFLYFPSSSELWRTDGTTNGTKQISPKYSQLIYGDTFSIVRLGDKLFFPGRVNNSTEALWCLDEHTSPTLFKDLNPGGSNSTPDYLHALNGKFIFTNNSALWCSDGTTTGTIPLSEPLEISLWYSNEWAIPAPGNVAYFKGKLGDNDWGLYRTDGTPNGTFLVNDLSLSNISWVIINVVAANDNILIATDELWISDGTDEGTHLVTDISPPKSNGVLGIFAALPPGVILSAIPKLSPLVYELWGSNGTEQGTVKIFSEVPYVQDLRIVRFQELVYFPSEYSNSIIYSGGDPYSTGLCDFPGYRTDFAVGYQGKFLTFASESSKVYTLISFNKSKVDEIFDFYPPSKAGIRGIGVAGGYIYFDATNPLTGSEPWISDGTKAGTRLLKDINPGIGGSFPRHFANIGNIAYFEAYHPDFGYDLWRSDGTEAGTVLIKDTDTISGNYAFFGVTPVRHLVYYVSRSFSDYLNHLYVTDGTSSGTTMIRSFIPYDTYADPDGFPKHMTPANDLGLLFFVARDEQYGEELWVSDGTPDGTRMLKDINPGPHSSRCHDLTWAGGKLFFTASNGISGMEMWATDGTEETTRQVTDLCPGPGGSFPTTYTKWQNLLFFAAQRTIPEGMELWAFPIEPQIPQNGWMIRGN